MNKIESENKPYYKLSGYELERLKRVSDITGTDYMWLGDFICTDDLICMVEDLLVEYNAQVEKYEEYQKYVDEYCVDTYNPYDEYGISQSDFI